ncbi:MAG TPA: hypothetical protein DEB09_04570 [Candidatus Magasanikbacteria bacterium]|nr:hypothetical protein [Candidatus Magasanikbacteria bacterium]
MLKIIKISLVSILTLGIFFLGFSVVLAGDYGLKDLAARAELASRDNAKNVPIQNTIGNVIGAALSLIAVLFFFLMVYGGYLWIISKGNSEQSKKATETIFAAIIGLLVILGSYALTNFIFTTVK